MYEERRETFSVRDIILQILLIVLFVLLLVWIFPTKTYVKKLFNGSDNGTQTIQVNASQSDIDKLSVLYNQIFANNIAQMKEAAISYYTNERLPQNVGDTDKMTLEEMYEKHLLVKLYDKTGAEVNASKSYVSITKYKNEYQMKVFLSSGEDEDYIIVYLGCYDYCKATGVCEKQVVEKTPANPSTPSKDGSNKPTYKCKVVNGKYYDKNGVIVSKNEYEVSCPKPETKYTCKVVNGKYYDKNGNIVSKAEYEKSCPTEIKYTCTINNGKYYDADGKEVTKEEYEKSCSPKQYVCEYKLNVGGKWSEYGEWSKWTTNKITASDSVQVETKTEKEVVDYKVEKKQVGTKTETYIKEYKDEQYISGYKTEKYIAGYTTEKYVSGYTTEKYVTGYTTEKYVSGYKEESYIKEYKEEKYISGYTTEKYISGYVTQKVKVGTKQVQTGTTTKTITEKVAAGTTNQYVSSGSGTTIPSNGNGYIYVKTGSKTTQSCSSCATKTTYTWDVYKVVTVYKTVTRTEQVPVYSTEDVYETKQVPVYATKQVPQYATKKVPVYGTRKVEVYATRQVPVYGTRKVEVYSTRQVPVYGTKKTPIYATKKVPVYGTRTVPVYEEVKVPVYKEVTYYRSRTRTYVGGYTDTKWSTCDPVDETLTKQGYSLTGNRKLK